MILGVIEESTFSTLRYDYHELSQVFTQQKNTTPQIVFEVRYSRPFNLYHPLPNLQTTIKN